VLPGRATRPEQGVRRMGVLDKGDPSFNIVTP
jgi:hypothetical protein